MFGWKHSGIAMSQSENKFLDNATMYAEGVQVGGGQKRKGFAIGKYVDLDGDMITVFGPYSGYEYELKFFMGTGKYKGIKGSYKSERVTKGKAVMPGTYQICTRIKGTYELAPK